MLKHNIIIISAVLLIGTLDCEAMMRGGYVHQTANSRYNQNIALMRGQTRASQLAPATNFVAISQPDEIIVPDSVVNGNPSDETINEIMVPQKKLEENNKETLFTNEELSEIIISLNEIVNALNSEIGTLDGEISRCNQEKRTNKILTVVGATGTLGTGIGAIIQGKKLHDAKKEGATEKQRASE